MDVIQHPLAPGLAQLGELNELLGAELGPPPGGWTSLARLSADRSMLEDAVKRNALAYGGTRRIAATFVAGGVAWAVTAAPLALMTIGRHAIGPDPETTFMHIDARGEVRGAFYDDPSFCVLAGEAGRGHRRAAVVDDLSGLHEWMRSRLVDSLTPFVDALSSLTSLDGRGLWAQIAAGSYGVIVWAAQLAGRGAGGVEEAQAFLKSGPAAFNGHDLHATS